MEHLMNILFPNSRDFLGHSVRRKQLFWKPHDETESMKGFHIVPE
jgi:hypothetical protein